MEADPTPRKNETKKALTIGVVGIGAMGWAMACRLQDLGYALAVVDIRAEARAAADALGMRVCCNAAELAGHADMVLIVVVNAEQIATVISGPGGLLEAGSSQNLQKRRTHTVLLCSTIAPTDSAQFAHTLQQAGLEVLDAPISGGPARARAGTLSMMLAGSDHCLENCTDLLADLADKRFVVGQAAGKAAQAKLVNNMLAGANLVAGAEALALANTLGLDGRQMFDIICASSGASWIFADRMARALAEDFQPRAAAHILTKDVGLATDMAAAAGHAVPMADAALARFRQTLAAGWAELDDSAVIKTWQRPDC
ncbi:MAG: L-threonate dehydrogenase [Pseudomonadota bacterium]|jgi:3-hydroxyisobutyrate dehydrogenase